ncbi:MAG: hypothetical protein LBF56_00115 [Holosporales bacterium]|nr:hypothetical protein [Holosporales bacterium]
MSINKSTKLVALVLITAVVTHQGTCQAQEDKGMPMFGISAPGFSMAHKPVKSTQQVVINTQMNENIVPIGRRDDKPGQVSTTLNPTGKEERNPRTYQEFEKLLHLMKEKPSTESSTTESAEKTELLEVSKLASKLLRNDISGTEMNQIIKDMLALENRDPAKYKEYMQNLSRWMDVPTNSILPFNFGK